MKKVTGLLVWMWMEPDKTGRIDLLAKKLAGEKVAETQPQANLGGVGFCSIFSAALLKGLGDLYLSENFGRLVTPGAESLITELHQRGCQGWPCFRDFMKSSTPSRGLFRN